MEKRAERHALFAARKPLPGPPPARHFARRRGIRDIHDLQNVTVEALRQGGRIDVFAASVKISVCSEASGSIMTKLPGIFRVSEVPDQKSLSKRSLWIAAPAISHPFLRCDHQAVGDLDLQSPCIGWTGYKTDKPGLAGIGNFDDRISAFPKVRGIKKPAITVSINRHFECWTILEVDVRHCREILGPGLAPRKFRCHKAFHCRGVKAG